MEFKMGCINTVVGVVRLPEGGLQLSIDDHNGLGISLHLTQQEREVLKAAI